jgi:hypothetical protein
MRVECTGTGSAVVIDDTIGSRLAPLAVSVMIPIIAARAWLICVSHNSGARSAARTYHSNCPVGCRIHCLCSRMTSVDYCSFRRRPPQTTEWCRGAVPGVGGWDLTGPDPLQHGGQQPIHSSVAWIFSCDPSQDQRTDHIAPLVFILCLSQRPQVGLFQGHGRYPGSARLDHGQETLQHVPGWASFMASVGSALVCKTRLAFSSWLSDRARLWPDPLER